MKNSSDTVGNRTRNLPACSAVPQPTAPLHDSGAAGIKSGHYTAAAGCKIERYIVAVQTNKEWWGNGR